jgi:hypothetical protein
VTRDECLRAAVLRNGQEVKQDLAQLKADGRIVSVIAAIWRQREMAVLALCSPDKNTTPIMQADAIARPVVMTDLIDEMLELAGISNLPPDPRS